jgi:DNA-binding SARP family transcriptional activator
MLEVRLLGQFEVRRDGTPISIPSRAAQSLLAYLLLNLDTAHRREKLAGLIWPNASDEIARRNLRQELWRLRKSLASDSPAGGDYLLTDDISIAFNKQADYWLDISALECGASPQASTGDLMSLLSLYRGDLLPGFYDDWAVLERERLRAIFEQEVQRLLDGLVQEQGWTAVLEWSERWIAFGQSPEPAYRALMLAYGELGDRAKIALVYQRCVESLRIELGVEPSEETRALYERLSQDMGVKPRRAEITPISPVSSRQPTSPVDELPAPGETPFKGLQYFDEADADLFFGREVLTARLVNLLRSHRFLVVVGASGSGKSSLVRAGLVPALKRRRSSSGDGAALANGALPADGSIPWQIHVITPTAHPLEALAVSLTRDSESVTAAATLMDDLARDARSLRLAIKRQEQAQSVPQVLLVIDQFEELFTLCRDDFEREAFIDNLLTAAAPDGTLTVVITLRADFYSHLAQHEDLRQAAAQNQEYIGPMNADALRRAIEGPAGRGGWEIESGLVDLLLREVGDEPGTLPLLSHALLETWKRRRGHMLTHKGYAESGGVRGAIAKTAETVYRTLSPEQQTIARNIFLRLTELGEGTEDTRRRARISELMPQRQAEANVRAVLTILADARLITLGEDTAEVAHEALIREWPMLREWLAQDREGLRLHRRLTEAAHEWELLERDPGSLYRSARLAQANEFGQVNANSLNELERAFLAASNELEQQELREREAQRQRELEAAQKLAEEQQRRAEEQGRAAKQLRQRAVFLSGAFVLAIVLAGIALFFGEQARQSALAAQENARNAEQQGRIATARELAASANSNLGVDPERSILLALQAIDVTSADQKVLPEAEEALHRAVQASHIQFTLRGFPNQVATVAYNHDGTRLATFSQDGTTKLWDAATGKELFTIPPHAQRYDFFGSAPSALLAYSPDGSRLATRDNDIVHVWESASGKELFSLVGHTAEVLAIAYSPDGTRIVTGSGDKNIKIWDAESGKELLTLSGHKDAVASIAFSPDGRRIASASNDQTARVWDAASGKELYTFRGHSAQVWSLAFSRDGTRIVAGSVDDTAIVFDAATGTQLQTLPGHTSGVYGVAFSPDGTRLLTASDDGTARVYLLRIQDLVALARTRLTRTWTPEECQQFLHTNQCPSAP